MLNGVLLCLISVNVVWMFLVCVMWGLIVFYMLRFDSVVLVYLLVGIVLGLVIVSCLLLSRCVRGKLCLIVSCVWLVVGVISISWFDRNEMCVFVWIRCLVVIWFIYFLLVEMNRLVGVFVLIWWVSVEDLVNDSIGGVWWCVV